MTFRRVLPYDFNAWHGSRHAVLVEGEPVSAGDAVVLVEDEDVALPCVVEETMTGHGGGLLAFVRPTGPFESAGALW